MKKILGLIFGLLFFLWSVLCANATMITYKYSITIYYADSGNDYGLSLGDVINCSVSYDNANIPDFGSYRIQDYWGGDDSILHDELQHIDIIGVPGGEFNDPMWIAPYIDFLDGELIAITGSSEGAACKYYTIGQNEYSGWGIYGDGSIPGMWDVKGTVDYSVPEPATMVFLVAGMLGIAGLRWRCNKYSKGGNL